MSARREIVLDTETTGLSPEEGDRIIEIGAVELINYLPTENHFHTYINPGREVQETAFKVHGLSNEFLQDKPMFDHIADQLLEFMGKDALVIHNAKFDVKFLNYELKLAGKPLIVHNAIIDTLEMARRQFPGSPASLDALCRRFGIDNSDRSLHGALLDSQLLSKVYLELIGGRQPGLEFEAYSDLASKNLGSDEKTFTTKKKRYKLLPNRVTDFEVEQHKKLLTRIKGVKKWAIYNEP
jgi:DNA polymerase-3 subunit epsilon